MGLVFAVVTFLLTIAAIVVVFMAAMMSDAPTANDTFPWWIPIIGFTITAALVFTHYHHIGW